MSNISPDDLDNSPGLQYPSDINLDPSNPTGFALKNAYDNLFYLRRKIDSAIRQGDTLSKAEIEALIRLSIKSLGANNSAVIVGTHLERITSQPASRYPLGKLFLETDRHVIYAVETVAAANAWVYAAGQMKDALASRPSDLGLNDTGFFFVNSELDQNTNYFWTGTEWVTPTYIQAVKDSGTSIGRILQHLSAAGTAVGFKVRDLYQLTNSGGVVQTAAILDTIWTDPTFGAETSAQQWYRISAGSLVPAFHISSLGFIVDPGDLSWYSSAAFRGIFAHGNTATRTYTFPDADMNPAWGPPGTDLVTDTVVLGASGTKVKAINPGDPTMQAAARASMDAAKNSTGTPHTIPLAPITGGGTAGSLTIAADGSLSWIDPT